MLRPPGLPGVRQFAADLWEGIDLGELSVVGSPYSGPCAKWLEISLEALNDICRERGDAVPVRVAPLDGLKSCPLRSLGEPLQLGPNPSVDALLESFGREPAVVVSIHCSKGLSNAWSALLADLRRRVKQAQEDRQRPYIFVLVGHTGFPPFEAGVGVRVRSMFNMVRWEEMRLLAGATLSDSENPLVRAWRVCVYSAVSGADPDLLEQLCLEAPNSLKEAMAVTLDYRTDDEVDAPAVFEPFLVEHRWQVPASLRAGWAAGHVHGATLERGIGINVTSVDERSACDHLRAAIWREQVSGLLPTLMEMGFDIATVVLSRPSDGASDQVAIQSRGPGGRVLLEPAVLMDLIRSHAGHRVARPIWEFLSLLRRTRNDLAHMSPVEYARVRDLWHGYDLARRHFSMSGAELR